MSIKDFVKKIKSYYNIGKDKILLFKIGDEIFIIAIIFLVGFSSFGLGRLSAMEKKSQTSAVFVNTNIISNKPDKEVVLPSKTTGLLVASKNGTKYYFPNCSGASKIKEENKIYFNSFEEARSAGLTSATNCPGLK